MLEGSLECNMTIADDRCKCHIASQCTIKDCQCIDYCSKFEEILNKITKKHFCWFTHSPKPNQLKEELIGPKYNEDLVKELYTDCLNNKAIGEFLLVPEVTEGGRLHFHALIELKDKVKFYKTFVPKYYWRGINKFILNQKPKYGYHYLFKLSNFMQDYFECNTVLTRELSLLIDYIDGVSDDSSDSPYLV